MSAGSGAQGILARIQAEKPHLAGGFHNLLEAFAAVATPDEGALQALYKLTLATEFLYCDPRSLVPLALARGELAPLAELLHSIGRIDYRFAGVLLAAYPRLPFSLQLVDADMRLLARSAAEAGGKGPSVLETCLSYEDPATCRFMLSQMAIIASRAPAALAECASMARAKSGSIPVDTLMRWLSRGTDLLTSDRGDEGLKFLLLKSSSGRRMLGMKQVVLEDFRKILKIYTASLSGQDLNINSLELSMYGIATPYTDGASLFLPPEIRYFHDEGLNERAYSAMAALMASGISQGSYGLESGNLPFRTELRERYGTLLPQILANLRRQYAGVAESVRERKDGEVEAVFPNGRKILLLNTEHERFFYSFPQPDFARQLFGLVENARIEARLGSLYPGLRQDFSLFNAYAWKRRTLTASATDGSGEFRQFFATLEATIQFSLVGKWDRDGLDARGAEIAGRINAELAAAASPDAGVQETAAIMFRMYNLFFDSFRLELICGRFDIRQAFEGLGKPQFYPEIVLATRPELLSREGERGLPPEEPDGREQAIDLAALRDSRESDEDMRKAIRSGKVRLYRYPEYDHLRGGYLPKHCTLFESVPLSRPNDWYEEALRRHAQVHKRTRKRFLSMKPDEMELSRHWHDGSDINICDAVDYCMSIRRGETPDEKIYCQKILNRRDLVVAILLDSSNSTDMEVGNRRVIDLEKESLAILASALDAIDDPFGLFSFNSSGPGKVYVTVVKDFQERWEPATWRRISALSPYESNRDGCAIRHVSARLSDRPERTKLLLLLSDGIPADIGYGAQTGLMASSYAIEDTRRAIIEARELGIIPFCLNIDSQAKAYISHLYGSYHYAILDDVARLPERLSQLYLRLTG